MLAAPGHQVDDPVDVHAELGGDLLRLGVAAELALEGATRGADLVELLDHVHRQPDHAGLLGDAAGDGLAHPPGGVGGELEALGVVELLDRADQAGVALLDQVQHRHLAAAVLAGDRDDQPQVGLMNCCDGALALLGEPLELLLGGALGGAALPAADAALGEQVLGEQAGLDGLGQLDLGDGVEQRGARDLVQVQADAVASLDLARDACDSLPRALPSLLAGAYPSVRPCNRPNDGAVPRIPGRARRDAVFYQIRRPEPAAKLPSPAPDSQGTRAAQARGPALRMAGRSGGPSRSSDPGVG